MQVDSIEESLKYYLKDRIESFIFPQGQIRYIASDKNSVIIRYINLNLEYRNKGIWSKFLNYIVNNYHQINIIIICGLENYIIEYATTKNILLDNYWANIGRDVAWHRDPNQWKNTEFYNHFVTLGPQKILELKQKIKYQICITYCTNKYNM